jgi:hypothetical protein
VAVEGVELAAAGVPEEGTEDLGAEVEEATDEEIRVTMLGTYGFAF